MDQETKNYLPQCLQSIVGKITSASLKVLESNGRTVHTYSVSWTGQAESTVQRSLIVPKEVVQPVKAEKLERIARMARCNGPCKKMKPYDEMHIIGLCEHDICRDCIAKAPSVSLKDGGSGCPNEDCYAEDLSILRLKKEKKGKRHGPGCCLCSYRSGASNAFATDGSNTAGGRYKH